MAISDHFHHWDPHIIIPWSSLWNSHIMLDVPIWTHRNHHRKWHHFPGRSGRFLPHPIPTLPQGECGASSQLLQQAFAAAGRPGGDGKLEVLELGKWMKMAVFPWGNGEKCLFSMGKSGKAFICSIGKWENCHFSMGKPVGNPKFHGIFKGTSGEIPIFMETFMGKYEEIYREKMDKLAKYQNSGGLSRNHQLRNKLWWLSIAIVNYQRILYLTWNLNSSSCWRRLVWFKIIYIHGIFLLIACQIWWPEGRHFF